MEHDDLIHLKTTHPALRFLTADHLPLMASFFYAVFVKPNRRSIPYGELASSLDDRLFALRKTYGDERYPKSGREYLDDWVSPGMSYLRKYYVQRSDEPECDLMPEIEKALLWVRGLTQNKGFIGTESRLLTLLELLRELTQQTENDPTSRITTLEKERASIDAQIEMARAGLFERLQSTQIKERFYDLEETAQKLLGDFRQIESNFRDLDRQTRELIATSESNKGSLLDEIFTDRDVIWDSDQGKSFRSFWEFLMSPLRQEEMDELLRALYSREEIQVLKPEPFLARIKLYLLEAGEKVYKTNNLLTEQLRKFLDDKAYLESRRIMDLIKAIEKMAIELKTSPPVQADFMKMNDLSPEFDLALSRGLFTPSSNPVLSEESLREGKADISLSPLYKQLHVDERRLRENINKMFQVREQFSLKELIDRFPLEKGLAEAVTYLNIATKDSSGSVLEENVPESIAYQAASGAERILNMPRLIFVRNPND